MWKFNQPHIENDKLDKFGDELLRALDASDAEISTAATSPFLFRRIRVRIEAEARRRTEERSQWLSFVMQTRKAIPVLALLAIFALGTLFYLPASVSNSPAHSPADQQQITMGGMLPFSQDEIVASVNGWEGDRPEIRPEMRKEQR